MNVKADSACLTMSHNRQVKSGHRCFFGKTGGGQAVAQAIQKNLRQALHFPQRRHDVLQNQRLHTVRVSASEKMEELTERSLRLFRAELSNAYQWKEERQTFEMRDFRGKSNEFNREYPVVLSTTYSIKGTLNIDHIYDYLKELFSAES